MHRITSASLIAILASGCVVGGRLAPAQLRARVGTRSGSPPPPPPAAAPSAVAPAAPASGGCYQEFGQDAPNTRDNPMVIEPGTFEGCTEEGGEDWFAISAPASAAAVLYEFTVTAHNDESIYPCIEAYDGEGAALFSHCEYDRDTAKGWAVVAGGTPVIFDVGDSHDGPYTATVNQVLLSDPDEPNDEREHATRLELGRSHSAIFASAGADRDQHVDWYVIDVPRAGILNIEVLDPGLDIHLGVEVSNADREAIDSDRASNQGANLRAALRIPEPGRYFLYMHQWVGTVRAADDGEPPSRLTKPYTITATLK